MLFRLAFKCTSSGETGNTKLEIDPEKHKTVRDLKLEIQNTLNIPRCDQRLYFEGRLLISDTLQIRELYFRENDELYLEFLAKAEIEGLDKEIQQIKNFHAKIVKLIGHSNPLSVALLVQEPHIFAASERVKVALATIGYHFFTPWKQGRSLAHRHYFVQEGGFDAFLWVFEFSLQVSQANFSQLRASSEIDHEPQVTEDSENEEEDNFNDFLDPELQYLQLQTSCLGLLWNFLETAADRQLAYQKKGLSLAIASLMVDPRDGPSDSLDEFWQKVSINEEAIGCVAGFVEHNCQAQRLVASNRALIDKVLDMLIEGEYYGTFYRQLAINLLFYCSFDAIALNKLAEQEVHLKVIAFLKRQLDDNSKDIVFRYYSSVFLARVRTSQRFALSPELALYVDQVLIEGFLYDHTPVEIAEWEEEHSYVWITLKPLVHLAFAGGKPMTVNSENENPVVLQLVENSLNDKGQNLSELQEKGQLMATHSEDDSNEHGEIADDNRQVAGDVLLENEGGTSGSRENEMELADNANNSNKSIDLNPGNFTACSDELKMEEDNKDNEGISVKSGQRPNDFSCDTSAASEPNPHATNSEPELSPGNAIDSVDISCEGFVPLFLGEGVAGPSTVQNMPPTTSNNGFPPATTGSAITHSSLYLKSSIPSPACDVCSYGETGASESFKTGESLNVSAEETIPFELAETIEKHSELSGKEEVMSTIEKKEISQSSTSTDREFLKIHNFYPPLDDGYDIFSLVQQGESNPEMLYPGSLAVQRLGIFSLQHLLFSEENCTLVKAEKLLDYLVCLQWQLGEEEGRLLRGELGEKFNVSQPPSLRIMAQSVLARKYGFDAIEKF